jgi:hypothetical protein
MVASSSGWPGHTNVASGRPGTARSDFSNVIRSYLLLYLEHTIQDGRTDKAGNRLVISRRLQFIETDATGATKSAGYAPYLDYRPVTPAELALVSSTGI